MLTYHLKIEEKRSPKKWPSNVTLRVEKMKSKKMDRMTWLLDLTTRLFRSTRALAFSSSPSAKGKCLGNIWTLPNFLRNLYFQEEQHQHHAIAVSEQPFLKFSGVLESLMENILWTIQRKIVTRLWKNLRFSRKNWPRFRTHVVLLLKKAEYLKSCIIFLWFLIWNALKLSNKSA